MYKKNGKKKKEIAVEENSQLSLGWMDRKYIFFPNIEDRHKNGVVSSLNVTSQFLEPRTFLGFSRSSLATGHTMHTGTLHPPSPSRPPANEHGGHSPTVCQSPSSYAFFMRQLGKVGFLPVEISDWYWLVFSFFGLSSLSLCSVIRSIKSFWVSFSSHRGRIFQVRSKETPKEMLGELTIRLRMYFPYNKCDNQNLSEIFFVLYT